MRPARRAGDRGAGTAVGGWRGRGGAESKTPKKSWSA